MHANQANELVAFIDGKQVIFRRRMSARISQTIRQESFHVRLHSLEYRVAGGNVVPRFQRQQRLHCSCRTGIHRNHSIFKAVLEKKCHVNRDHQAIPLGVTESEIGKGAHAPRYTFELYSLAAEQNCASLAGAEKPSLRQFDQVRVIGTKSETAQLTTFERAPLATRQLAQSSEAFAGLWKLSRTHGFSVPVAT